MTWPPLPPGTPSLPPRPGRLRRLGVTLAVSASLLATAAGVLGALLFRPRLLRVPSNSMAPTIESGRRVVVIAIVGRVERGDVVVMRDPDPSVRRDYLRRVVVLPREVFQIVDGRMRIDGNALDEPYVAPDRRSHENYGPYTMPAGQYFLLGDNRADSFDSRYTGVVPRSAIWARLLW